MKTATDIYDMNCNKIFLGDRVSMFGMIGKVTEECGAVGISFDIIDWDRIESKIFEVTGCDNVPCFCYNDNFISFWEILWNFNCECNICNVVEIEKRTVPSKEKILIENNY